MLGSVVLAVEEEVDGQQIITPVLNELIWGTFSFVVFAAFVYLYVWPRFTQTLEERTAGIEGKLAQAEADRAEAQQLLEAYRRQLDEARGEAARIRTEAQAARAKTIEDARAEASQQAAEVVARGEQQLAAQRQKVVGELRAEIGTMALQLAGRVVGESLEDEARQRRTVDRFLDELEAEADRSSGPTSSGPTSSGPTSSRPTASSAGPRA